jgi:predicted ATPase
MLSSFRRDFAAVDTLAGRMRRLADQHQLPGFEVKSMIFSGWSEGMTTDPSAGLARIEAGLAQQQSIGTSEDFPVYLDMYCELLSGVGAVDKAAGIIQDAISRAEREGHRSWLAELYRRRASVERLAGRSARKVKESIGIAMRIAAEQGAKALERRAAQDLQALMDSQVARG